MTYKIDFDVDSIGAIEERSIENNNLRHHVAIVFSDGNTEGRILLNQLQADSLAYSLQKAIDINHARGIKLTDCVCCND